MYTACMILILGPIYINSTIVASLAILYYLFKVLFYDMCDKKGEENYVDE